MSDQPAGRRSASPTTSAPRWRVGPALVLPLVLPLAALGASFLVRTERPEPAAADPRTSALTRVTLACPSSPDEAEPSGGQVSVTSSLAEEDGEVTVDPLTADAQTLSVRSGRVTTTSSGDTDGAVVLVGEDAWAPGLMAARVAPSAAAACSEPQPDAWYAAVGARPGHRSVVELVNPDPGPAVVDLTLYAPTGPLDVAGFRGLRVPGRSALALDLSEQVPRRTELGLHVQVSRGRLATSVRDSTDRLGTGPSASDWLAPQAEPLTSSTLLGLPRGDGTRRLALVNASEDETRVTVRVVSPESTFAPEGLGEIRVPPQSIRSISIDGVLAPEVKAGALGILVESSGPVAASLQTFVGDDLAPISAGPQIASEGAALLPPGKKELLVAGAERPGVAVVVTRDEDGTELGEERVAVGPDRGVRVALPARAAYLSVQLERTPIVASVLVGGGKDDAGSAVVPLHEVRATGLVPTVRPALP
jgi:hypothetical protein